MRAARLLVRAQPARLVLASRRFAAGAHRHEEVDPVVEVLANRAGPLSAAEFRTMVNIAFKGKYQQEQIALAGQLARQLKATNASPELVESARALQAELTAAWEKEEAEFKEQSERNARKIDDFVKGQVAYIESLPQGKNLLKAAKWAVILTAGIFTADWFLNDFSYHVWRTGQRIQWRNGGKPAPPYLDKEERRLFLRMTPTEWRKHKWNQALDANPKAKALFESIKKDALELKAQEAQELEKMSLPVREWNALLEENPALKQAWREHFLPVFQQSQPVTLGSAPAKQPSYW